jgi:hypothetical protein
MGMHHGYLVAPVPPDQLLAALDQRTGEFRLTGSPTRLDDLDVPEPEDGFVIAIGQMASGSVLLDMSFILSSEADLIVDLSRQFGGTVVGAGAETTSGSYWFVAARDGRLIRHYHNSASGQTKPFDQGEPLASEAEQPLEDLDGDGLIAGMGTLGFDISAWEATGTVTPYEWTYERPPEEGPMSGALNAFLEEHGLDPDAPLPSPTVVRRGDGGFDLAPPGSRVPGNRAQGAEPKERKDLLGRLFGR